MENQASEKPKKQRLKLVIVILAVLLVLSAGGLAARYIYLGLFAPARTAVTVPDNLIGEKGKNPLPSDSRAESAVSSGREMENGTASSPPAGSGQPSDAAGVSKPQAAKLILYQGKSGDNEKFEVRNMLPGDCVTKYFCIKAYHNTDITLFFHTEVTEETKALGDVLHIKLTHLETGKVLCDASFSEVGKQELSELLQKNQQDESIAYYQIDVSMDTSVGNEYQAAMLKADFRWYVKDENGLTPPQTGDATNVILWSVLALSSFLLVLLFGLTRRKENKRHE